MNYKAFPLGVYCRHPSPHIAGNRIRYPSSAIRATPFAALPSTYLPFLIESKSKMNRGGILRLLLPLSAQAVAGLMACAIALLLAGCISPFPTPAPDQLAARDPTIPREQNRYSLAPYRVMPPDILLIDAVYNVRGADSRLRSGDQVTIRLLKGLPLDIDETAPGNLLQLAAKQPELQAKILNGPYLIGAEGDVDLGAAYGRVPIAGLTVDEARATLEKFLHEHAGLREPKLSVVIADVTGRQVVAGQHLVRPDGTVGLGIYGDVHVAGMTLAEIRKAVEVHLSMFLNDPVVSVDVFAYNSKVFYIITDGGGNGQQVVRVPCTGNETVLDAIAQINGLPQVSSKRIWIARPSPECGGRPEILCVNWNSVTADGVATTNYQLLPGDRVYVQADSLVATDNFLAKVLAPVNRILGSMLLGISNAEGIQTLRTGTSTTTGTGVF
jgi:polysaccharide biosynthesis/export protein